MSALFVWSCNGFVLSGVKAGPLRAVLRAFNAHGMAEQFSQLNANEPCSMDGSVSDGRFVDRIVLEFGALRIPVAVQLMDGHLFEHSCGRYFTPADWNRLPDETREVGGLRMMSKTCGCGAFMSFADVVLIHVEAVMNCRGGTS